jgi:hypothetical protein
MVLELELRPSQGVSQSPGVALRASAAVAPRHMGSV